MKLGKFRIISKLLGKDSLITKILFFQIFFKVEATLPCSESSVSTNSFIFAGGNGFSG